MVVHGREREARSAANRMWTEPLTPVIRELDEHMFGVAVLAGDGTVCAHVRVAYSLEIATGCFGTMISGAATEVRAADVTRRHN